ncbi:hypothetical protein FJR48_11625 [Sulfurimonas lithotrophica]|uniref:Uncharacterized protein n=1 Tax=Sulfurimonas lithotrophica TaxID=2590022 RepID=A0A5P8P483_9BACT|nr:hypothetical protein [Sulfurimonas lithotrophica]QFR50340.1 hypothetical protein FJR48_11625 [Sulfurimonas lithotrophica]
MEASLLIQAIAGLVIILGGLLFILLKPSNTKKTKTINIKSSDKSKQKIDLNSLRHIIRNRNSSKAQLSEAVDLVIKHHGKIPDKMGLRLNPQFDVYMEMMISLCRHKNATKDIVLKFDRELTRGNPDYKSEINDAVTKGLNSRK